ncbi:unnamed protein product [Dimorphilus gyrociliatus]|uniref:Uncharacterized protein n=1 Tax=Dimorphilus gyrociliatus TaxID=2664684 RepID=A0A7I8VLB6_9ANNE|nr:unnamed protein product [Dimorphilus gyrociliatus]
MEANQRKSKLMRDVSTARMGLETALNTIILKAEEEDEKALAADQASNESDGQGKRFKSKKSRKSKKYDEYEDQPFVMRMFERTVDLTHFDGNSPLYAIARAWILNQSVPTEEIKTETKSENLKNLQLPTVTIPIEDGEKNYRVPEPIEHPETNFIEEINRDPDDQPGSEALLLDHMQHWKKVKESWREHSRLLHKKHGKECYQVLRKMFDSVNRTQETEKEQTSIPTLV